jgi:beta-mannosidase
MNLLKKIKTMGGWCLLLIAPFAASGNHLPLRQDIAEGWKFKQARAYNWYPATVPGVVHGDLINNRLIEDPFFRLNERGVQWIDKEDWIYETVFDTNEELLQKEHIRICFEGLDTYADVTLNGEKILSANNMFRRWEADVKPHLKAKGNRLQVYFHSPVKIAMPEWEALPFQYRSSNDQSENGGLFDRKVGVFVRKAGYHFGWDWGPRLVTSGIWRPVRLEGWDEARIEDVHYIQTSVSEKEAHIEVMVEIWADEAWNDAAVLLFNRTDNRMEDEQRVRLIRGWNKAPLSFKIKKPRLWWTNGLGEAFLYGFSAQLKLGKRTIDTKEQKLGLRSIRLVTRPDDAGERFCFELNGTPLFAKGANYIPCDNLPTRVTDSIYEKTVRDAADANMNMLRVWGGGIYENDLFYDLCDQYGILVWQDFMFACALYPAEGDFLENIRLEAIDNVRRLRNHSCIALWCGNNECLDAWFNWNWKATYDKQNPAYSDIIWKQFKDLYFVTLPEVVAAYHPGVAYRKSSPYSDDAGTRNHTVGDMHYWEVWQGLKPLSEFKRERSRFFSEYGFQSFPEFESIKKYAPEPQDWEVTSEVMMAHQRGGMSANNRIRDFLMEEYRQPKDFRSFVYMSQLLQADAIKTAMEAHRRDKPYCMGSLVWQHNDCWPVASWSSRDYYGRWKAQHYFTVKSFADLLVSPVEKDGELQIDIVSDRLKPSSGTLSVQLIDVNKGIINRQEIKITVPPNAGISAWKGRADSLLAGLNRTNILLHVEYADANGKRYENNLFFAKHKEINYPKARINRTFVPVTGGFELTITSDTFARGVFVSLNGKDDFISDNYMDLLPGRGATITVTTALDAEAFEKNLNIISFVDAY